MSEETCRRGAERIVEHCVSQSKKDVQIVFHGGEPLLGKFDHLRMLFDTIRNVFQDTGVSYQIGMQSNGLLFTPEIGELMRENRASIGISLDGPPHINDRHRIDHMGRGSGVRLHDKLILIRDNFADVFSGFLCVIDVTQDPIEIYDYLAQFEPKLIDYLLPYDNHDRLPPGKTESPNSTPYADWMISLFDYWCELNEPVRIRHFESIVRLLSGASSLVESSGLDPVDLIVMETNGEFEAVDSLKAALDGVTELGFNAFDHSINEVAKHVMVKNRQIGSEELCDTCRGCSIVDVCGGGYLPTRYSADRGFDNPSVYCSDHDKLIHHVLHRLQSELKQECRA